MESANQLAMSAAISGAPVRSRKPGGIRARSWASAAKHAEIAVALCAAIASTSRDPTVSITPVTLGRTDVTRLRPWAPPWFDLAWGAVCGTCAGVSSRLNLRLPPALLEQLTARAAEQGVSVNQLMVTLLAGGIGFKLADNSTAGPRRG